MPQPPKPEEVSAPLRALLRAADVPDSAVQGDRFDAADEDVSYAPDLEDDPDHPEDILPDEVRALPEVDLDAEDNPELTARPLAPRG